MALILNIESSTEVCSAALAREGKILDLLEDITGQNHSMLMTVYIEELLKKNNISPDQLEAVAVSAGPGSYTGLRIGVAAAKGICYALKIPLIAITSLASMAHQVITNRGKHQLPSEPMFFCPMIDARRMEVYTAFFNDQEELIREIQADIIVPDTYQIFLNQGKVVFFGNGAAKCKETLTHSNAVFLDNIKTSAHYMVELAEKAYQEQKFEDVAYYEPFYLKDFVATISTKNVFRKL
jgi:tRNA threonylcarbamoyladenosine biosynthesis protein TsaB